MEHSKKEQVTQALTAWIDPKNPDRSAKKLADKAGINMSYVSHIKNGQYSIGSTVIDDQYFRKISYAIGLNIDDELHFDTVNLQHIVSVCKSAQLRKKIVVINSKLSGVGKTYALEYVSRTVDKTLYIKCTSSMGSNDLLKEILHKLNIKDRLVGQKAKIDAIRDKVMSIPGYMIMIDEVEDVRSGIYKVIKEIIDFTYKKCAVIVAGMRIVEKINGLADRGRPGFAQLRRRLFTNVVEISGLSTKEIASICESFGITTKTGINWFSRNVSDYQMLFEYISDALRASARENRVIDADFMNQLIFG